VEQASLIVLNVVSAVPYCTVTSEMRLPPSDQTKDACAIATPRLEGGTATDTPQTVNREWFVVG